VKVTAPSFYLKSKREIRKGGATIFSEWRKKKLFYPELRQSTVVNIKNNKKKNNDKILLLRHSKILKNNFK